MVGRIITNAAPARPTKVADLPDAIADRLSGAVRFSDISLTEMVGADPLPIKPANRIADKFSDLDEAPSRDQSREAARNLAEQQRQQVERGVGPASVIIGGREVDAEFLQKEPTYDPTRTPWKSPEVVDSPLADETISLDSMFVQTEEQIAAGVDSKGNRLTPEEISALLKDLAQLATIKALFNARDAAGNENERGSELCNKLANTAAVVADAGIKHPDTDTRSLQTIRDLVGGLRSALGAVGARGTRLDSWMAVAERTIAEAQARQAVAEQAARDRAAAAAATNRRSGSFAFDDEVLAAKAVLTHVDQALQIIQVSKALRPGDKDEDQVRRAAQKAADDQRAASNAQYEKVKRQVDDVSNVRLSTSPVMLSAGRATAQDALLAIGGLDIPGAAKAELLADLRAALSDIIQSMEALEKASASTARRAPSRTDAAADFGLGA